MLWNCRRALRQKRTFPQSQLWPEADLENTDLETVIQDLLSGQYTNPVGTEIKLDAFYIHRTIVPQQREA